MQLNVVVVGEAGKPPTGLAYFLPQQGGVPDRRCCCSSEVAI